MAAILLTIKNMNREQSRNVEPRRNQRDRNRDLEQNNKNQPQFKGCITCLEKFVFHVQYKNSYVFNTSTKRLAEHIARTIKNGNDCIKAFESENLSVETLNEPANPGANAILVDIQK